MTHLMSRRRLTAEIDSLALARLAAERRALEEATHDARLLERWVDDGLGAAIKTAPAPSVERAADILREMLGAPEPMPPATYAPDPQPSRVSVVNGEAGETLTIYAVALVFQPRVRGSATRVMVRQFAVQGSVPLGDKEAITWAVDLVVPHWPADDWGALTEFQVPVGVVGSTVLTLPQ